MIKSVFVFLPESSSMIGVHVVRDEELSTSDHRVCDNQLSARVWREEKHNSIEYNYKCIVLKSSTHIHLRQRGERD